MFSSKTLPADVTRRNVLLLPINRLCALLIHAGLLEESRSLEPGQDSFGSKLVEWLDDRKRLRFVGAVTRMQSRVVVRFVGCSFVLHVESERLKINRRGVVRRVARARLRLLLLRGFLSWRRRLYSWPA